MNRSRRQVLKASAALLPVSPVPAQIRPTESTQTSAGIRIRLRELVEGYRITQMVHVAAKLDIADHLKRGPLPVKELARLTSTHEDSLYRLLRTLAGLGVFAEEDGPAFRLTPMGNFLCSDAPGSLRVSAEVNGEPWMWRPWGHLMHSIKTGEVAFDNLYGIHTWDWFAENPGPAQLFNSFMDEVTGAETSAVVSGYDFSGAEKVVDIGGGRGVLLTAVLGTNLKARGVLFDLPHVIQDAKKKIDGRIAGRIELAPGDFFKAVPSGGDLYLLKNIIHDWNDVESGKILAVLHKAMAGRGRLLLIEQVICAPNAACLAKTSDMNMMVKNGGRNRTEKEYRALLGASRFNLTRVVPTAGPSIIEAVPVTM
jgi:hypothetical protein